MALFDTGTPATPGTGAVRTNPPPAPAGGVSSNPDFNILANQLRAIGLGALFTVRADGTPSGWLWEQFQAGVDTEAELMAAIQQTDVFRNRFGVIIEQQRRAAAGQPGIVMTPGEVLEYEARVSQVMRAGGLPTWFYDQPQDLHTLILNDMSVAEVEQRVAQGFEYVDNAPPEVRAKFEEFYGVAQGDAALAAYVLDPTRTTAQLERATRTAYASGMAQRFDLALGRLAAERIADQPRTEAGIVEGLTQVAAQAGLFEASPFEQNTITAEDQGVRSVFEGDAEATRDIERRAVSRRAGNRAATGGAVLTQQGLTGAGSSG